MKQLEYDLVRPQANPLGWVVNVLGALWNEYKLSRYEYYRLFNSVFDIDPLRDELDTQTKCRWCGSHLNWYGYCPFCDCSQ